MKKHSIRRPLSYADSGVDIDAKEEALLDMEKRLKTNDKRILTSLSAFASLFEGSFPGYKQPVLVLKTEEPGSKQLLAFQEDKVESICADMINHLINDIAVMGGKPLIVQDCIICGKLEKKIVSRIVQGVADACRAQGCTLTGGETSEQPGVLQPGTYVLSANVVGVVEKKKIIDGSRIRAGDVILGVASNGLHTNGYSLVRSLLKEQPALAKRKIGSITFMDAILKPHVCYYNALTKIFDDAGVHGLSHITGSGIAGNVERILPKGVDAEVDLKKVKILEVFSVIRDAGAIEDAEMLRTYNMGVGLVIVADPKRAASITSAMKKAGHACYELGRVVKGSGTVRFTGKLSW